MFSDAFFLKPTPPFRLDLTVWALRRMPHNEIDRWDGRTYTRVFALDEAMVRLDVGQPDGRRIRIDVHAAPALAGLKERVVPLIEKTLGIRKDLLPFYRFAERNDQVARLAADFLGVKPPRFPSVYEAVINAVACQQLSLNVGITLLDRITQTWGRPWTTGAEPLRAFPLPQDLAAATVAKLRELGFSSSKAKTIIAVSREVVSSRVDLEALAGKTDAAVTEILTSLPGIGPWSAQYVMLRGLGRTHVFPGDDSGAQRSLQVLLALQERPDAARTAELVRAWYPHAGLLYFHFLLNRLRSSGCLDPGGTPAVSSML